MDESEERLLRALADTRTRRTLFLVRDASGPLQVTELAAGLVEREGGIAGSRESMEQLEISLHHEILPRLAEFGAVGYDPEERIVSSGRTSLLDAEFDPTSIDDLLAWVDDADDRLAKSIEVLEGRQTVVERGRQLIDGTEEELFVLFGAGDLLEPDCLDRARAAVDRGVSLTVGSRDAVLRERLREEFPSVAVWEPQLDWLAAPDDTPTIARLVLADRQRLLLSRTDESTTRRPDAERAIVSRGERDPLVGLVRELLGPRLDHLDYRSPGSRSNSRSHHT